MVQKHRIASLTELVDPVFRTSEVGSGLFYLWYRGHSSSDWKLVPSVHRDYSQGQEYSMTTEFRMGAGTRHTQCPADTDYARWIALMRHFGLPTRILDWTESPLAALFFAVDEDAHLNQAGAVWQLNPALMNKHFRKRKLVGVLPGGDFDDLLNPAFDYDQENKNSAAAVVVPEVDLRMAMQHAVFTIHGDPTPLESSPAGDLFLRKFEVPAEIKLTLRSQLRALGIRRATLFPDLTNLASDLARQWKRIAADDLKVADGDGDR